MQKVCSLPCAQSIAEKKRQKIAIAELRQKREALKSRSQWVKEAQTAFNKYIRLRDHDQPCISCGRYHNGQYHAGHYLSTGARPGLRFNELNVHKQCAPCNNHLSGNAVLYRIALIGKIGLEAVEKLESDHEPRKYSVDDLKEIIRLYKEKTKALKAEIERRAA